MKNAALILNVILLAAVAVLFYLHFSSKAKTTQPAVKSSSRVDTFNNAFRIAYFEMDSVENSFQMVKDITKDLNEKEQGYTNQLARMEKALYDKASEYENKSRSGTMSQTESEFATNDMNQRKRNFDLQKDKYRQEYQNYSFRRTNEVKQAIQDFLSEYNKTRGFAYIITNEAGFMYYKDTVYNITADVVKGLNENYKKKK
jgi:outer membrane protein